MRKDNLWSDEEIHMLLTDMSDKEIPEKIGRSAQAVYNKRHRLKMNSLESDEIFVPHMSQQEKLARIYKLAEKLQVRLLG